MMTLIFSVIIVTISAAGCTQSHPARFPSNEPVAGYSSAEPSQASPTGPPSAPSTPCPAQSPDPAERIPSAVNQTDPGEVSCAALTLLWTIDTTLDQSAQGQRGAILRAAASGLLTPRYAAQLRAQPTTPAPQALWQTWIGHRAYTRPQLSQGVDDGAPPTTATHTYQQWKITLTPTGRDGWKAPANTPLIAFLTLTRIGPHQPWHIDGIHYT